MKGDVILSIRGFTFDRAPVPARSDRSLYSYLNNDKSEVLRNRGNGIAVTTEGLTITVDTGTAIIQGTFVEITNPITLQVPPGYNGHLCIVINLSQLNEATGTPGLGDYIFTNNQLKVDLVQNLTHDDLNNNGIIYTFDLGSVLSDSVNTTFTRNSTSYGGVVWHDLNVTLKNDFTFHNPKNWLKYSVHNGEVHIWGELGRLSGLVNQMIGAAAVEAFTLPQELIPQYEVVFRLPMTSDNSYMIHISGTDGRVMFERVTSWTPSDNFNVWFPFYISYRI